MARRFGSWQISVMNRAIWLRAITFYSVAPRGRAGAYNGRYKASFESLNGAEWGDYRFALGPVGPRGGVGLTATPIK